MMWDELPMRNRPLLSVVLAALAVLVLSILIIQASVRGTGPGEFGFTKGRPAVLSPEADIAGELDFDKGSYLPGDLVRCRIRILWRKEFVTPDFESFQSSISLFPLDHRSNSVSERSLSGGVREYVADFMLQAVNVDATESYLLATAAVYYTSTRFESGELRVLRINPPRLQVGELYPQDISDIPLQGLKPGIDEPTLLRQWLMVIFGAVLIGLAMYLLRRYGRKRPAAMLSEAERLWHKFNGLDPGAANKRQLMLNGERIFVRALFLRTGIDSTGFWSGSAADDSDMQKSIDDARILFSRSYQPEEPDGEDIDRIMSLVREMLAPLVAEDELKRELEPSFATRLRRVPVVLATSAFLVVSATAMFALAAKPSAWLSSDVLRYNNAAAMLGNDETLERGYAEFSALAQDAEDEMVKSASLYNTATLITDPRISGQPPLQQRELLTAIFLPGITLDQLLHALEVDAEFELLGILSDTARRYVQAEAEMKAAVRIRPNDPDIRRNLEILGKVRRALANTLARLINDGEQSSGRVEMMQQTIIDLRRLMELDMPEDFARMVEGKDDTNYFILEQF